MRRLFLFFCTMCVLAFVALPVLVVMLLRDPGGGVIPPLKVNVAMADGRTAKMDLEEYVGGVVRAEMPSSFHREALAAQAVAARTYAVQRMLRTPEIPLSADPAVNQAWKGKTEALRGLNAIQALYYRRKIEHALRETRGQVLLYEGLPIDAVYHSTSGPYTASAEEVWGKPVSYLSSVPCTYCAKSPRLRQELSYSTADVARLIEETLRSQPPALVHAVATQQSEGSRLEILSRTESGRVREARYGDITLTGNQVRAALGLPSTEFELSSQGDRVTLHVEGFGHGVGMCQYGADGMAREGKNFRDILAYYYRGALIGQASECLQGRGGAAPY